MVSRGALVFGRIESDFNSRYRQYRILDPMFVEHCIEVELIRLVATRQAVYEVQVDCERRR